MRTHKGGEEDVGDIFVVLQRIVGAEDLVEVEVALLVHTMNRGNTATEWN